MRIPIILITSNALLLTTLLTHTPLYAPTVSYYKKLQNRLRQEPKETVTIQSTSTKSDRNQRKPPNIKVNRPPTLNIPYISSAFTNDIKKAVKRCNLDIHLIERPQSSLKNLLVESRPYDKGCKGTTKCNVCRNSQSTLNNHCSQKDIVYSIKCDLCHDNDAVYIGETSRPLSQQFQEHYRSAANPTAKSYKNMAFSKHYKTCH